MFKSRALALAAVALVLTVSGCAKNNPGATVWTGTVSSHAQAVCWSQDAAVTPTTCAKALVNGATANNNIPSLEVIPYQTVGISVDPKVAENGWYVAIGGQRFNDKAITGTYFRFTFPNYSVPDAGLDMQIIAQGKRNVTRGIWIYKLLPQK